MADTPQGLSNGNSPHFVILIHGIRTQAEWEEPIARALRAGGLEPVPIRFRRFSALRFLLPISQLRRRGTDRLDRSIRAIKVEHKDAIVSVIAHSFGTYSVARLIARDFSTELNRVILAGSVVDRDFPWEDYRGRFQKVVNDCGSRDVWPVLAESATWGYGSTGTFGFGNARVRDRFFDLPHSGLLTADFASKYWLPFLRTGEIVDEPSPRSMPSGLVSAAAALNLKWMAALLLIVASLLGSPHIRRVIHDVFYGSRTPTSTPTAAPAIPGTLTAVFGGALHRAAKPTVDVPGGETVTPAPISTDKELWIHLRQADGRAVARITWTGATGQRITNGFIINPNGLTLTHLPSPDGVPDTLTIYDHSGERSAQVVLMDRDVTTSICLLKPTGDSGAWPVVGDAPRLFGDVPEPPSHTTIRALGYDGIHGLAAAETQLVEERNQQVWQTGSDFSMLIPPGGPVYSIKDRQIVGIAGAGAEMISLHAVRRLLLRAAEGQATKAGGSGH